jgi:hypothetical protein
LIGNLVLLPVGRSGRRILPSDVQFDLLRHRRLYRITKPGLGMRNSELEDYSWISRVPSPESPVPAYQYFLGRGLIKEMSTGS